jgi:hypothetical protein
MQKVHCHEPAQLETARKIEEQLLGSGVLTAPPGLRAKRGSFLSAVKSKISCAT